MTGPIFYDDLAATLAEAWRRLEEGARDRRGGFHAPTLATIGADGPRASVVVLRGVEPGRRRLRFHCDARAHKAAELARDPRAALTAYDHPAKIQVRAEGAVVLHRDGAEADAAWAGSQAMSLACYGTRPAPGTPIGTGGDYDLPEGEAVAAGRTNFVAAVLAVHRLEFLYLARAGHRRALFAWGEDGEETRTWLTP